MKPRVLKFKRQEEEFAKQISSWGEISQSSEQEDMFEHWDIKLQTKFDVKAVKRVRTAEGEPDDNIHYVEFINVNGELGWLYGKADYIAFELNEYWAIVDRRVLRMFVEGKCIAKETCETPELYKIYSRGKDKMTLVRTIDLLYISELQLHKNEVYE